MKLKGGLEIEKVAYEEFKLNYRIYKISIVI